MSRTSNHAPTAEVHAWARSTGLAVPERGRLRSDIWHAWLDAHSQVKA